MSSDFLTSIHIMAFLARVEEKGETSATSEEIAKVIGSNPVVIRRMIKKLKDADLVKTVSGAHGGVHINKPSKTITVLDVFNAINPDQADFFSFSTIDKKEGCHAVTNAIQEVMKELMERSFNQMKKEMAATAVKEVLDAAKKRAIAK